MGLHSQELQSLILRQVLLVARFDLVAFCWPLSFELIIELYRIMLTKANVCHQDCFLIGISSQLVLLILVVQVGYVVVTDTNCLVVLPTEEHTSLGEVNQGDHIVLLFHELVLGELVIRDQVAELVLQVTDFLTLALLAI